MPTSFLARLGWASIPYRPMASSTITATYTESLSNHCSITAGLR
jgi:hypothetical protein